MKSGLIIRDTVLMPRSKNIMIKNNDQLHRINGSAIKLLVSILCSEAKKTSTSIDPFI